MSFDLYRDEVENRIASLPSATRPEPGMFSGTGMVAMQTFAKAGSAFDLLGAVGPIVQDKITGGTEAQDRYFKEHDEVFGRAVDYWTPKPHEVSTSGQVVGQLLATLPMIVASPAATVAATQLSTAEDLVKKGVDAGKAQAVGAVQAAGLGLGIWVPILGKTLTQRVLAGGAGFNAFQGVATRGVSGEILEGTTAAGDFKAFDPTALTLDVLLGAAFGGLAHAVPSMRAEGDAWHKRMTEWGAKIKPSEADALVTLRQAQHLNADSMPGKPADMGTATAHVDRIRKAIDDLANDRPVQIEDMPAGKFDADPERQAEASKAADSLIHEGVKSGAVNEFDAALLRDDTLGTLPRGIVKGGIKAIRDIITFAKSGPANEKRGVRFASVADAQAAAIRESIGADVSGYTHMIDNFGIRHALNEHGNPEIEARRGNVAITDDDILKAPEIVKAAERIESGGKDAAGRDLVRYVKTVKDGTIYYVEEVRTKRNEFAFKTMWKKPPARDMPPGEPAPVPLTSETLRGSDSRVAQKVGAGETATVKDSFTPGDPLVSEAARFAAENLELRIEIGRDANGELITITPREWMDQAEAEVAAARELSDLFEVAAACILGAR